MFNLWMLSDEVSDLLPATFMMTNVNDKINKHLSMENKRVGTISSVCTRFSKSPYTGLLCCTNGVSQDANVSHC